MNQGEPSELITRKEEYWTHIEPNTDYELPDEWGAHGGKLMVFGNEQQIVPLAQRLSQYDLPPIVIPLVKSLPQTK